MDMQKIDMYLMINSKYFPQEKMALIRNKLLSFDENKFMMVTSIELKDPTVLLVLSLLVGSLGIDRFMLEDTGLGIVKLLTGGGCGIWTIIDWFLVQDKTRQFNFNKIMSIM